LPEDNGERFFSQHLKDIGNKQMGDDAECLCHLCDHAVGQSSADSNLPTTQQQVALPMDETLPNGNNVDNGAISPVIQTTNGSRFPSSRPRTDVRPNGKDTRSNAEHKVERKR